MGYRRAVLTRWSRRDRLAVLVIAVTVAFLSGATLVGLAVGTQTTAFAEDFGADRAVTYHGSPAAAETAAGPDDVVLPVARVATNDSPETTAIGVPDGATGLYRADENASLATEPGVLRRVDPASVGPRTVSGPQRALALAVESRRDDLVVPGEWFVTAPATVDRLGPTGAFVLATDADGLAGVPLLGALRFFERGTGQLLELLALTTLASAVLVVVTIYSVTALTVADRETAIRVIRATGGPPLRVVGLFGLRAALLAAVGSAVGYAGGVIGTRLVVNAAIVAGVATSIEVAVEPATVPLLAGVGVGLVVLGGLAGVLAAAPAVYRPASAGTRTPASGPTDGTGADRRLFGRLRRLLATDLLAWRALVPTTATLTVFVAFVLLIAAVGGVVAPLAAADTATAITEPGASHPVASKLSQEHAAVLRAEGYDASPEILLLSASGDQPYLARGVNYSAYAGVTGARIVRGRAPTGPREAVVGADLADALGVAPGEALTVGGSTERGFTRVEVVGVFAAAGVEDDQLLVSLPVARHLTGVRPGRVNLVRVEGLQADAGGDTDGASDDDTPIAVVNASVARGDNATVVTLALENQGVAPGQATITVALADRTRTVQTRLRAGERASERVAFPVLEPGTYRLRAGDLDRTVTLADPNALTIERLPDTVPPGAAPLVVLTSNGEPVANATVAVANRSVETDADGRVRVPFDDPGEYTVTATAGDRSTTRTVAVRAGADRPVNATLRLSPDAPTVYNRPTAIVRLANPWTDDRTIQIALEAPGVDATRTVDVPAGTAGTLEWRLDRRPAGTYAVTATVDDRRLTREYRVRGDRRLGSTLPTDGVTPGGGVGQAIEFVLGNVTVLLASLLALSGAMTVGGTTAAFARAVRGKRHEIGVRRATGATPRAVFVAVLADATRIGLVAAVLATGLAVAALQALLSAGRLRVYGITLRPALPPRLLAGVVLAAVVIAVVSAALAATALLRRSPAALLAGEGEPMRATQRGGHDRESS